MILVVYEFTFVWPQTIKQNNCVTVLYNTHYLLGFFLPSQITYFNYDFTPSIKMRLIVHRKISLRQMLPVSSTVTAFPDCLPLSYRSVVLITVDSLS